VPARSDLSAREARWLAVNAQGLGRPRPKSPITRRHLRGAVNAVGTVQLDAINVVARTQFLVLFSRVGPFDPARLHAMTGPGGELFEYWGHAASLLPTAHQPLFRWRMEQHGPYGDRPVYAARRLAWEATHADYIASVLQEVKERGPLSASQLSDPRRRNGEWWDRRSVGRLALEWLFARGDVTAYRSTSFARLYDLPDRVFPPAVVSQPTPPVDEAQRRLLVLAARSLGVGTLADLAGYYVINVKVARTRVAELVEAGDLIEVRVDGWRERGYVVPDVRPARPSRRTATLLSPFDSLIWDRRRTLQVFGFDYRIEVYVPAPQRTYGYFVLPVLLGDSLVARLDLKADRQASVVRIGGAYVEPGADAPTVAAAVADEVDALRQWLGLDGIAIARRGNLATALRPALREVSMPSTTPR
jgi:uncharacterized protein YcaQ